MADEEFMFGDLSATVRVQDLPASREVVAVERQENGTWRVCGSAIANTDGIAELGIEGSKTSRVYAFAIDHWGEPFTPNRTVAYGDIIRPSVFLGWLYRVTAPGVLPGEEPVWWNSTPGMPRPVGSAMAQAEMYFQPIAHGPVDIEWEDKQEGDPHWDNVVSLLHFDGVSGDTFITDERGNTWQVFGNANLQDINPRFGKTSLRVDGLGSYIQTDSGLPESSDFTAEAWVYLSESKLEINIFSQLHPSGTPTNGRINLDVKNGYILAFFGGTGYPGEVITDLEPPIGSYFHVAFCRNGPDFYVALNGQVRLAFSNSSPLASVPFRVCRASSSHTHRDLNGYVDELRITKGVARYTENFTPPSEPFPNFK